MNRVALALVLVCVVVGTTFGVRRLPCFVNAGYWGFKTVGRVAPNLICSLHLDGKVSAQEIEDRIGDFQNLTDLSVANSDLTSVPQSIFTLKKLRSLNLAGNQLTSIPQEVGQLQQLETLNVSSNSLETLPEGVSQLANLRTLDLSLNQFQSLPSSVISLYNLEQMI